MDSRPVQKPQERQTDSKLQKAEHLHFADLFQILRVRRRLLYVFTLAMLAGAIAKQVLYVPTFTAESGLTIQKAESNPLQAALANLGANYIDNSERMQTYVNYLTSPDFFLAVAETLKFTEGYHRLNLTNPSEMSVTGKKFWQQLLSTRLGAKRLAPRDHLGPEPELVPVENLAALIQSVSYGFVSGTDSIRLRVTTLDPFTAMIVANTAAEVFMRKTGERDYSEVTEVKRFIQQQLDSTTERLKRSELALVEFKRKHNIISMGAEQTAVSGRMSTIEAEIEAVKIKREENIRLIDFYETGLARRQSQLLTQGSKVTPSSTEVGDRIRGQIESLRYKKVLVQAQGYGEDSWQMKEINGEIEKATDMLKKHVASDLGAAADDDEYKHINTDEARKKLAFLREENRSLELKSDALDKSRATLQRTLGTLPQDEQVMLTLTRDVDLQFELYSLLKKKLQEVEIQQVALQSRVSISARSGMPGSAPRTNFVIKMLFAILVGVFLGSAGAFLLEALDPTVKHRSDLENLELITLGSIPHIEGSPLRKHLGHQTYRPDLLICKEKTESPESMSFKHVRAQLMTLRASDGKHAKVITITSPERGDGKSFISGNLAVSFSQLEKRTILLDCDFRNPSLPWLFGYKNEDGLSSLLTLKSSIDEVLIRDWIPNLDILPAGWYPPNPSELISQEKFKILLEHLRSAYDYIIIDSPPAIAVVDACVLASLSDASILAASYRKTRKDAVLVALKRMLQVTHKQIYALLNNVREGHDHSSQGYSITGQLMPSHDDSSIDSLSELRQFEQALKKRAG